MHLFYYHCGWQHIDNAPQRILRFNALLLRLYPQSAYKSAFINLRLDSGFGWCFELIDWFRFSIQWFFLCVYVNVCVIDHIRVQFCWANHNIHTNTISLLSRIECSVFCSIVRFHQEHDIGRGHLRKIGAIHANGLNVSISTRRSMRGRFCCFLSIVHSISDHIHMEIEICIKTATLYNFFRKIFHQQVKLQYIHFCIILKQKESSKISIHLNIVWIHNLCWQSD